MSYKLFDQAARLARIKKENEEHLAECLKLYQIQKILDKQDLNETIIESLSTIEFFKTNCPEGMKLDEFIINSIRYFQYEMFTFGQAIFHHGEYGDKMYIILKGEVGVFAPRPQEDIIKEQEALQNQEPLIIKGKQAQIIDNILRQQDDRYHQNGVLLYQKIFQYYSGQGFGDVALTSDKPRSASIISSSEQTHCISIRRNDFKQIFQKSIQQARSTLDYFQKLFPNALRFNISKFIQYLRPQTFQSKSTLWEIGDEPNFFFIIITGRIELYKYINQGKPQEVQDGLFIGKVLHKTKIVLSQMGDGNIVGQEELLDDMQLRQYYCETVDVTQAYCMDYNDYKAIAGNHPDIVESIQERALITKDYINRRQKLIIENYFAKPLEKKQIQPRNTSASNCIRSNKPINSQTDIIQLNLAFIKKQPQQQGELKFIVNNDNLNAIKERMLRLQSSNNVSPSKQIKNKIMISQILKKYNSKKLSHEKKDMKRRSIFVTASQSTIQSIPTENSIERRRQKSSIIISTKNRLKYQERVLNNNSNSSIINLTETETRTHQKDALTPTVYKFFKTIRSISGK